MAIEDLDLEFEDEEEKKDDALAIDVDLSFSAAAGGNSSNEQPKTIPRPTPGIPPKPDSGSAARSIRKEQPQAPKQTKGAQVQSLDEARKNLANKVQAKPQVEKTPVKAEMAPSKENLSSQKEEVKKEEEKRVEAVAQKTEFANSAQTRSKVEDQEIQALKDEIKALKDEVRNAKHEADLKVAVAEAKAEFVTEYLSNAKLMEHQAAQIIQKIHVKAPQLKNDLLSLNKSIAEFVKKASGKS